MANPTEWARASPRTCLTSLTCISQESLDWEGPRNSAWTHLRSCSFFYFILSERSCSLETRVEGLPKLLVQSSLFDTFNLTSLRTEWPVIEYMIWWRLLHWKLFLCSSLYRGLLSMKTNRKLPLVLLPQVTETPDSHPHSLRVLSNLLHLRRSPAIQVPDILS